MAYKKPEHGASRRALVTLLADHVILSPAQQARATECDHLLDAALCVLAAADFRRGRSMGPPASLADVARREGWIWVRRMAATPTSSAAVT
jgi:hypothetical protein